MRSFLACLFLLSASTAWPQNGAKEPVQVFILMGQSNMVGLGKVSGREGSLEHAVKEKRLFPYLVDAQGAWKAREDVRHVRVMVGRGGNNRLLERPFELEWKQHRQRFRQYGLFQSHRYDHARHEPHDRHDLER